LRLIWSWLNELIEFDGTPEELAHALTMNGIEVSQVESAGHQFESIRVGEVLDVLPHPNADMLKVCHVSLGEEKRKIVCGAPNVAVHQKVPVILPGGALPDGKKIEAATIRGETSEGMIGSAQELGFQDSIDGIWVLDPKAEVGTPLAEAAGLSDYVLELEVTPNRGDCLSVLGIAREVATFKRTPLHLARPRVLEHAGPIKSLTSVTVESPDLCPRYTARVIEDITVGPSPIWMQWRLQMAGIRPINNVVDITNYVLLERGQPLHAFDLDKLREGRIVVRGWTAEDKKFTTLDGEERVPPEGACMICDGVGPVAVGGVMGGVDSEVHPETRTVLLESAYFLPESIRRTSRALGLSTEASYRFEREVDPEGVLPASDRAADLLLHLTGGKVARGALDSAHGAFEKKKVVLRIPQITRILGIDVPIGEVSDIMLALGMEVMPADGQNAIAIHVPTHRPDLSREIDLIEEVARIVGYDQLPTTLPVGGEIPLAPPSEWEFLRRIRTALSAAGLFEAVNLTFVSEEDLNGAGESEPKGAAPRLRNPLSREGEYLRTSLWPGLLKNTAANMNHNVPDTRLFEAGRVFHSRPVGVVDPLPSEELRVAAVLSQLPERGLWTEDQRERDFYDIKGLLESLLVTLGINGVRYESGCGYPFHPIRSATAWLRRKDGREEEKLGELGEIHPDVQRKVDLPQPVMLFEVSAGLLWAAMPSVPEFRPLPRFPATSRDLAVVMPERIETGALKQVILDTGGPLVREAVVFDVHIGTPVPDGQKSVAFALLYRADDRTLTGEEVSEIHDRIVSRLSTEFSAQLR
jgi:phenylalanyl-tRNA synthetase beta chain